MKLTDFIKQHREEFDHREPGPEVWKKIEDTLPAEPKSLLNNITVWRIASILLLGLSLYLGMDRLQTQPRSEVKRMQGEFNDLETFYSNQIAEKTLLIEGIESTQEDDQFTQDYQKLDAMYQVLREQMKIQPTEKVKDALVLNLLVRIDLLNQQLKKLEESRKERKSVGSSSV